MRRVIFNENGFSLIEMLLVLMVTLLLSTFLIKFSFQHIQSFNKSQIEFETQIVFREAQFLANANNNRLYVGSKNGLFYIKNPREVNYFFEQQIPSDMKVIFTDNKKNMKDIQFIQIEPDMMMDPKIAGLVYETDKGRTYYTMNFGKGRFTYAK